jgi:hypothetical protein
VTSLRTNAAGALPGCFPAARVIDHKAADNPYQSLYGNEWGGEIEKTTAPSGFVCITKMVHFIVRESAKLFVGTAHEHDCFFYHDALLSLTAADTIEWMKTQHHDGMSYYDRWIKPVEGLNEGTVNAGRLGNGPELMSWDASLNKDVDDSVAAHVAWCSMMAEGDTGYDKRFTRYTPATQLSAYLRVLDPANGLHGGAPVSTRICQDVCKFLTSLDAIRLARGVCVAGLGTHAGHRAAAARGIKPRGGKRQKKERQTEQWIHEDAVGPRAQFLERSKERHAAVQLFISLPLSTTPIKIVNPVAVSVDVGSKSCG